MNGFFAPPYRARVRVIAMAVAVALPLALSAQSRLTPEAAATLDRVSQYVDGYFARAQSLMVEETVVVQPVRADLQPDGFARRLVYELRFEWSAGADAGAPRIEVVRELVRADNRPPRPNSEPKCLDPAPVTPEPLEFLLPGRRAEFGFKVSGVTTTEGRRVILLDYTPRGRGASPTAKADPKGTGDMDCVSFEVPNRAGGRIWVDAETAAVIRIDEDLLGPTEIPLPRELNRRPGWGMRATLLRNSSSIRYRPVTFTDPDETLMLPTTIENVWVTAVSGIRGVRMTQQYRNYRRFLTQSRVIVP
jgi:hypothetical protein